MSLGGDLRVCLDWNGANVERVRMTSSRRDAVARLLAGRTPEDALAWIPRAFGICAQAQGMAAQLALQGAGAHVSPVNGARAVEREIVDEYFFRLLIDWPLAAGRAADAAAVARVRRASHDSLPVLAARHVFGEPPASFLARQEVDTWAASGATLPARLLADLLQDTPRLGRSEVPLMPDPTREELSRNVLAGLARDPGYAMTPTWDGEPVETGALARMRAHPAVTAVVARDGHTAAARMTARLVELAQLLEPGARAFADGFASQPHEGAGVVQTARGLLVHRARVEDGRIVDYRIVAPTEWNFHPDGALAQGLRDLAASEKDELKRRAGVAVQALDPCVACVIEVAHA